MTLIPPRYEARPNGDKWGVFDTFHQEWAWNHAKIARFDALDQPHAVAQADALNRIYERAL